MKQHTWLAQLAARLWPFGRTRKTDSNPQKDRAVAARALKTRLPPHLRKDVGADDG
ncbi:hypothetical protein [Hyphomonas beringensis]|uniref:hypothetical protein n=1 Tax=Hyphomonas beringensis TaxID=1280946 RepID=UPI000B1546AE|nr:hypothetical protein [Hyphomonas beringensis]